jgi:hypothetical protein
MNLHDKLLGVFKIEDLVINTLKRGLRRPGATVGVMDIIMTG